MKKLLVTIFRAVFKPWENARVLERQKTSGVWTESFLGLLTLALGLAITSLVQAASGNFPAAPVFLSLSLENYFVWQALLVVPWILTGWIVVSWLAKIILPRAKNRKTTISLRQVSAGLALSFYPFLFWLLLSHALTAIFYSLGMSQKEWVDLMSEPGWFQFIYIALFFLAVICGLISSVFVLARMAPARKLLSGLLGSVIFLVWGFMVLFLLR